MKIIFCSIVMALTMFSCRNDTFSVHGVSVPKHFKITHNTTSGVQINSNVELTVKAINAIQNGINLQLERSRALHPEWENCANSPMAYTVDLVEPMSTASNPPGAPSLIVDGINAAGTTFGTGGDFYPIPTILLPHQAHQNWDYLDYLLQSTRNESEHIRLWACDRDLFFYYTGANDVHPIFGPF